MLNNRISTPAGKIQYAMIDGMMWFCIADIYQGFGYASHTPWSWHQLKDDHAQRFYRRYSPATNRLVDHPRQRGAITVINVAGLYSTLRLKAMRENPTARAFHGWLCREFPEDGAKPAPPGKPINGQIDMFGEGVGA